MKIVDLPVETREALGSANCRRLRRSGLIPLVLYGGDRDNLNLSTTREAFGEVLKHQSRVVRLSSGDVSQTALIREVAWDTFSEYVEHLDLFRVEQGDEVRVRIPFHFVGVPEGVSFGGEVHYALKHVEIVVPVRDIPDEFRVDVSGMNIGDAIHVGEYEFPEGVHPASHPEELIVQVKTPKVVVEETEEGEGEGEDEAVEGEAPEAEES